MVRGGFDLDGPLVVFDDFESQAETQAGSQTDILGGEEGVEDLVPDVFGNAVAIVGHGDEGAGIGKSAGGD